MDKNIIDIITDNAEVALDSLIKNEVLKEIPVLGTSVKVMRAIKSTRDNAYVNKVKFFIENVGHVNDEKKKRLIEESKEDEKSRAKFGDALFTAIDQSDSIVKVEYLALAFEAFLNNDFDRNALRLICHIINSAFTDELIDIIENERPKMDLKYAVPSGLADVEYPKATFDMESTGPQYSLSSLAEHLRKAYRKYKS